MRFLQAETISREQNICIVLKMEEITMMYQWSKKLMQNLQDIIDSYQLYLRDKGIPLQQIQEKPQLLSANLPSFPEYRSSSVRNHPDQAENQNDDKPKKSKKRRYKPRKKLGEQKQTQFKQKLKSFIKDKDPLYNSEEERPEHKTKKAEPTPYLLFLRQKKQSMKMQYPDLGNHELNKIIADVWKKMGPEEKEAYSRQNCMKKMEFERNFDDSLNKLGLSHILKPKRTNDVEEESD